jgi:hypothetical protein
MKFDRLTAGDVLGSDVAQLISVVPENITVFALSWVPHAAFGSCAHVPWRASR